MPVRPPSQTPPTPIRPRNAYTNSPPIQTRPSYMSLTMLPGFFVNSESEISASDVPTDGSIAFFPYADLSRIVIKQWAGGPTLETAVYVLDQVNPGQREGQNNAAPLPPPPPPVQQNQGQSQQKTADDVSVAAALDRFNTNTMSAFNTLGGTLQTIQENLEKLNGRFTDEGGCG